MSASAWLASHHSLERNKKLVQFKVTARMGKNEAIGFLHRFWWMVMQSAPSGLFVLSQDAPPGSAIASLSLEVIAEILEMEPERIGALIAAMTSARLLDKHKCVYRVHDWLDYTRIYLRDSLYKRKPDRFKELEQIHDGWDKRLTRLRTVRRQSAVSDPIRSDQTTYPPNPPASGGTNGAAAPARRKTRREVEREEFDRALDEECAKLEAEAAK